ncbi:hypothetical protein [Ferruginibacter sp.]|nr:hypothetical protein [Ferruginibacter sp.]
MDTYSTEGKEITYAFNVIKDFFNDIDMFNAIKDTENLIRSPANNKVYKKRSPGDLLFFIDRFEELSAAAFTIRESYSERDGAVLEAFEEQEFPDISKHKDFVPDLRYLPAWEAFPRNLTARQYFNPYKAIKKFISHMTEIEWKKALKVIIEYALSTDPINDEYPSSELMTIRLRMLQLIEACHLLHVRTNLQAKSTKHNIPNTKKK